MDKRINALGATYMQMTDEMKNAAATRSMGYGKPLLIDFVMLYDRDLNRALCTSQVSRIEKAALHEVKNYLYEQARKDSGVKCLLDKLPIMMHAAALQRCKQLEPNQTYIIYFTKVKRLLKADYYYNATVYATDGKTVQKLRKAGKCRDLNEVKARTKEIAKGLHTPPVSVIREHRSPKRRQQEEIEQIVEDLFTEKEIKKSF